MAEICVIYASEDEATVEKLITLLRKYWEVWWAVDIAQGDWEAAVKKTIRKSKAVLPVISPNIEGKAIFRDELEYASKRGNLIFPFVISRADLPFGFGGLNRTDAFGWTGQINHIGYQQLVQ